MYYLVVENSSGYPVIDKQTGIPFIYNTEQFGVENYPAGLDDYPTIVRFVPIVFTAVQEKF